MGELLLVFAFAALVTIIPIGLSRQYLRLGNRRLTKKILPQLPRTRLDFRTEIKGWRSRTIWKIEADVPVGTQSFHFPQTSRESDDPALRQCYDLARMTLEATKKDYKECGAKGTFKLHFVDVDLGVARVHFIDEKEMATRNIARWCETLDRITALLSPQRGEEGLTCPQCVVSTLVKCRSRLAEHRCETCGGVFLSRESAQTLIGEMQTDIASLKDSAQGADEGIPCLECRSDMKRVFLDDNTIVELCTHCGALWLDKGELTALSLGKHQEGL